MKLSGLVAAFVAMISTLLFLLACQAALQGDRSLYPVVLLLAAIWLLLLVPAVKA
jgi:hypothetical protein